MIVQFLTDDGEFQSGQHYVMSRMRAAQFEAKGVAKAQEANYTAVAEVPDTKKNDPAPTSKKKIDNVPEKRKYTRKQPK